MARCPVVIRGRDLEYEPRQNTEQEPETLRKLTQMQLMGSKKKDKKQAVMTSDEPTQATPAPRGPQNQIQPPMPMASAPPAYDQQFNFGQQQPRRGNWQGNVRRGIGGGDIQIPMFSSTLKDALNADTLVILHKNAPILEKKNWRRSADCIPWTGQPLSGPGVRILGRPRKLNE